MSAFSNFDAQDNEATPEQNHLCICTVGVYELFYDFCAN